MDPLHTYLLAQALRREPLGENLARTPPREPPTPRPCRRSAAAAFLALSGAVALAACGSSVAPHGVREPAPKPVSASRRLTVVLATATDQLAATVGTEGAAEHDSARVNSLVTGVGTEGAAEHESARATSLVTRVGTEGAAEHAALR